MIDKLITNVIQPVVQILFAVAIVYFVWGIFKYIRSADDPGERIQGGKHILYGVLGLFIMVSVWGIIAVVKRTIGVS